MTRFYFALFVLACSSCGREPTSSVRVPAGDNARRDGGTLIRRLDADIVTLNPVIAGSRNDTYVANYLFTPMIYIDRKLRPVPGLAKSWTTSEDGKLYTFSLDPRATFSDGRPVTSRDVLFTLRKIVDPKTESAHLAGSFELLDLTKTRAVDDHTIEVAFRERLAGQLLRFSDVYVIPEHIYASGDFRDDYSTRAVGSGPYKLVRREVGREIVLARRADYWREMPHIQTVVFKIINDDQTAWNALKTGQLDETLIASDTWLRERSNPALKNKIDFVQFYTINYSFIAWNGHHPILGDKRVRRALAMCIPTSAIIRDLYHGTARPINGHFTPDEWAYNPNVSVIRYDPEGARNLLASVGWVDNDHDGTREKGKRTFEFDLTVLSSGGTTKQLAQLLQAELKKVGIRLNLVVLDPAAAFQRLLRGNYDAAYLAWDLDPEPDPFSLFHSSAVPPHGQNIVFYSSAEADRLIIAARRELDQSKRKELYWRLHEVLAQDQPYAWVVQASAKWGISKRVHGADAAPGFGLFRWAPGEHGWWIANVPQPKAGTIRGW